MPGRAQQRPQRGGKGWLLWPVIAVATFTVVSVLLLVFDDEEAGQGGAHVAASAAADASDGQSQEALDVPAVLDADPNAEHVAIPAEPRANPALTAEDALDDEVAAGEVPEGELLETPTPEIPRGVVEVPPAPEWILHHVASGETPEQLAYRYGVRPQSLRMWNGLRPTTSSLKTGGKLKVRAKRIPPQRVQIEYVVKPGDTWWKIGIRYGVDSKTLRRANLESQQTLEVGQVLRVWVDPVVFEWVASEDDPGNTDKIRPGAVGIGPPQAGTLVNGVLLPDSPYYSLRLPPSSYGTTHAIESLRRGLVRFESRSDYSRPLILGSMSAKHGGPLQGHRSHQSGRDLDIRLPLLTRFADWSPVEPKRVDWLATWQLISALAETQEVVAVFLDYDLQKLLHKAAAASGATEEERSAFIQWPRGAKAHRGLVRHSPGHDAHVHVRFSCGAYEIECVSHGDAE